MFTRTAPHEYLGRFQIRTDEGLIGDTDGLYITASPVGPDYPKGLLVVQDGLLHDAQGKRRHQRFAFVSWADVEDVLALPK